MKWNKNINIKNNLDIFPNYYLFKFSLFFEFINILIKTNKMSLAFDETGRPYLILREQGKKKRVKGLEAHKVIINNQFIAINLFYNL